MIGARGQHGQGTDEERAVAKKGASAVREHQKIHSRWGESV
jgi:hypothetical protein